MKTYILATIVFLTACGLRAQNSSLSSLPPPPSELRSFQPQFFASEAYYKKYGFGVVRSPEGAIVARASNCEKMDALIDALVTLKRYEEPTFIKPILTQRQTTENWCEVKLNDVLTPYLEQTYWKTIDDNSMETNCWAHAARASNAVETVQVFDADSFTQLVASSQCRMLKQNEAKLPGDIVSIRIVNQKSTDFMFEESHAAVWLNEDVWITKNGAAPFEIASSQSIRDVYLGDVVAECAKPSPDSLTAEYLKKCESLVQIFRCAFLKDHIKKHQINSEHQLAYQNALPLMQERIHMQVDAEGKQGGIPVGLAYISQHRWNSVLGHTHFVELNTESLAFLDELAKDSFYIRENLQNLELVPLPTSLLQKMSAMREDPELLFVGAPLNALAEEISKQQHVLLQLSKGQVTAVEKELLILWNLQLAASDYRDESISEELRGMLPKGWHKLAVGNE